MSWQVGHAKADITAFIPGIVMLGYGNPKNTVKDVETPLNARVFWIENEKDILLFINLEVCFITQSITDGVWDFVQKDFPGIKRENIHISAQHTHAAPGGYTHYALYSVPTPGFAIEVLAKILSGIKEAITKASQNKQSATLVYKTKMVPLEVDVSFNRSLRAYNRNPEVSPKLNKEDQNQAVDREMRMIDFVDESGKSIGSWNWFAVHPTNIIWTNHLISPGNKGYASLDLEKEMGEGYTAVFAQGNSGDVSPIFEPGPYEHWIPKNDLKMVQESRDNGHKQYLQASELLKQTGKEINGPIDSELIYVDFSKVDIDNKYKPEHLKNEVLGTSPACLGVAFMEGAENAGITDPLVWLCKFMATTVRWFEFLVAPLRSSSWSQAMKRKYKMQSPKFIFAETGAKKVLGTSKVMSLIVPGFLDKTIGYLKKISRRGALFEHSWTQQVLPLQMTLIGEFAFVGIPAEPSTMSGRKIKNDLLEILKEKGIQEVVLCPYQGAYCGYITTPEEYEEQCYEGGHTVFGKWTLPAFQTELNKLAREMIKDKKERALNKNLRPPIFSEQELNRRSFNYAEIN